MNSIESAIRRRFVPDSFHKLICIMENGLKLPLLRSLWNIAAFPVARKCLCVGWVGDDPCPPPPEGRGTQANETFRADEYPAEKS
jgi:hypothetical protein